MGKLVWPAAGFAAAALAAEYLLPASGLPFFAAALAVLSAFGILLRGERRRILMTILLSAAAGLLFWWGEYAILAAPCEAIVGQDVSVRVVVTDYPAEGDGYTGIPVRVLDGAPRVKGYLYSYDPDLPALQPGDIIRADVHVLSAIETSAGTRRHTQTAQSRFFLARLLGSPQLDGRSGHAWIYAPRRLAKAVTELCDTLLPADAAPFARALMLGDRNDLYDDTALYGSMRASGVLHIVAVSGMHIILLVSFLQLLFGRGKRTALICIPVMLLFMTLTGSGASVRRAVVMQSVTMLAPVFEREQDGPSGLAAAVLVILLGNPMAAGGISFQLSFACVLGFIVLMPPMLEWCRRHLPMQQPIIGAAVSSVLCTICAMVFSLPLSVCYFGVLPLFSWLANLLTLPVVEICFAGSFIVCAAGALLPAAGLLLGSVLAWLFRWCMLVYRTIAVIPFGCLYAVSPGMIVWLAGSYVLFGAWLLLRRRGVRIIALIPVELCVIGACVVMLTGGVSLFGAAELTVLDVGQGACTLLIDETAAFMTDCGGSARTNAGDTAADYLLSRGRRTLDALILTHLHEDHTNGVAALMSRIRVRLLVLPADYDDEDSMLAEITAAAEAGGTEILFLEEEMTLSAGDIRLTLLLPRAGNDENERGIVVRADLAGLQALIMGDAGQSAEFGLMERGLIDDVDVLVVGHHGSSGASGLLFLRASAPETAVISVGAGNPYGHPAAETLEKLSETGAEILRTDREGNVTIRQKK